MGSLTANVRKIIKVKKPLERDEEYRYDKGKRDVPEEEIAVNKKYRNGKVNTAV